MERVGEPDAAATVRMRRTWVEVDSDHLRYAAQILHRDPDRKFVYVVPVTIPERNERPQIAAENRTVRQARTYADDPDVQLSRTVQTIPDGYKERVAARIRVARKNAGLTQQELADRIGKQRNHVSEWETGKNGVSVKNLELIAEATGVTVEWLLGAEGIAA